MEAPKTYTGYDKDGQQICYCTAVDANTYINPEEVQTAIDNIESVLQEEIKSISSSLASVKDDASTAVVAEGTNMGGAIEGTCTALDGVPSTIMGFIKSKYDDAVTVHDKFQQELNQAARDNVNSYEGVTSVSES